MAFKNNFSLAGGLFIVCVAGYYWGGFSKETSLLIDTTDNLPDYQMSDISGLQIDEQGQISRQMTAQHLQHFAHNDETQITAPVVMLYQQGQANWQVSANKAISQQDNQYINLQENVIAQRLSGMALRMETESLSAEPAKHLLYTQTPVLVSSPNGQIHSLGLAANTQEGTIHFTGQVRGTYVLSTP